MEQIDKGDSSSHHPSKAAPVLGVTSYKSLHSLLGEFIRYYCTSSSKESTEGHSNPSQETNALESSSSFYASFQSHTPEQQRVQFKFKLDSLTTSLMNDNSKNKEMERHTVIKHNARFTSILAFLFQVVLPHTNDEHEAETAIHSILYSFLYDRFHPEVPQTDQMDTIFWNTFTQGLHPDDSEWWLDQLQGLKQLCSLPEILYKAFLTHAQQQDELEDASLNNNNNMKRMKHSTDDSWKHSYDCPSSLYSIGKVWKRVYAMLGYSLSHILLSNTFDGVSYHEFIEVISSITSDDTIGFFDRMDRCGLYVSPEYSSFMVGVYGYVLDCMAISTNICRDDGILYTSSTKDDRAEEEERWCQCYSVQMKIDLNFVMESWCRDGIFHTWMDLAQKDNLPKRCFVTDIATILLFYSRYHMPQSDIYITCHHIIDFIDKLTSPECIESYIARVDSWQSSLLQNTNQRRKRKASKPPLFPFQPFLMYIQILLTMPSPSKALSLLHTLRKYENISISDHQKAWFCLFDYYHQNDLLLVSHPHHDSKHLPFQNIMVSSTIGHFFLDYLYSLMSIITEEVEQVIQRDNRNMSYEEESWLKYNQIRIRNTVLLYSSVRPALGKPLQLANLVAPSLDGSDFAETHVPLSHMSDETKIWTLLKENYDVVERPKSLDSELALSHSEESKDIEETTETEEIQALEMDSYDIGDAMVSEQPVQVDDSQEVFVLNDINSEHSVHSDLQGEDLDIGKNDGDIDNDLYVSGSEPGEEEVVVEEDITGIQENSLEVSDDEELEVESQEGAFEVEPQEEVLEVDAEEALEVDAEEEKDDDESKITVTEDNVFEVAIDTREENGDDEEGTKQVNGDEVNDEEENVVLNVPGTIINAEELGISSDDYVATQDDVKYSESDDVSQTDSNNSFGQWQEDYPDEEEIPSDHIVQEPKEEILDGQGGNYSKKPALERPLGSSSGSTQEKDIHSGFNVDDHTFTSGTNSERLLTRDSDHDSVQSSDDMADADDTTVEYSVSARLPKHIGHIDYGYDAEASGTDVNESDYTRNDESIQIRQSVSNTQEHVEETNLFQHEHIDEGNVADIEITENEEEETKQDKLSISGAKINTRTIGNTNNRIDDTTISEIQHQYHTSEKNDDGQNVDSELQAISQQQDQHQDQQQEVQLEKGSEEQPEEEEEEEEEESVDMTSKMQSDDHDEPEAEQHAEIEDDYSTMSYRQLQAECKSRGLSAAGKKDDLKTRLSEQDRGALVDAEENTFPGHHKSMESELEEIIQAAKESAKEENASTKESNRLKIVPSVDPPKGSRFTALIAKGIDLLTPKSKPNEVIEIDDSSVDDDDQVPSTPSLPNFVSVKDAPESAISKMSDFSIDPIKSRKRTNSAANTKKQHKIDASKMPAKKKAKSSSESYRTRSTRGKKRMNEK